MDLRSLINKLEAIGNQDLLAEQDFKFSPEQEKWLGGADRQDPYILFNLFREVPGAKPPISYFKDPEDQATAKKLGFPDAVMTATKPSTSAASPSTPEKKPNQGIGKPSPAETVPPGINPETGEKYTSVASLPLQLPPGAEPESGISVAGSPEKTPSTSSPSKQLAPVDPGTVELQKWLKSKGYDIGKFGADGRWGPDTQKAIDAMWADWKAGKLSEPDKQKYRELLNAARDTEWTSRTKEAGSTRGASGAPPVGNNVDSAIKGIKGILSKYKVENIDHPDDIDILTEDELRLYVLKNSNLLSESEYMEAMKIILSEAGPRTAAQQASMQAAASGINPPNNPFGLTPSAAGGSAAAPAAAPAAQPSKLAKFGKSLAGKFTGPDAGKKLVTRFLPGVGLAVLAWDVLSSAMDALSTTLDPKDKAELDKQMAILKPYIDDEEKVKELPPEVQKELADITKRVQKLTATGAEKAGAAVGSAVKAPFKAVGNALGTAAQGGANFAKGAWNA